MISPAQEIQKRIKEIERSPGFAYRNIHSNDEYFRLKRALPYANTTPRTKPTRPNPLLQDWSAL